MGGHKGLIAATIIAAMIVAAATLYTHFFGTSDDVGGTKTQIVEKEADESGNEEKPTPTININEVFVTPIETEISSSFYLEINNSGTAAAHDFQVQADFGEATPDTCEVVPDTSASINSGSTGSVVVVNVDILQKDASLYLVCNLNLPYFKQLLVSGGNIEIEKSLTYESYKEGRTDPRLTFYQGLWRAFLIVVFFGFFIFVLRLVTGGLA